MRDATPADLPAVAAIYTHYVLKTTITFNTHVRTPAEWLERYEGNVVHGPYAMLVAERDGQVVGYVETSQFRPHHAYARSLETSVYVAPDQHGAGIGRCLYDALFERLATTSFHRAYAIVALPNDGSEAFHRRHGFRHAGTLTEAGYKFGRWLDVAYYEKPLGGGDPAPGGPDEEA